MLASPTVFVQLFFVFLVRFRNKIKIKIEKIKESGAAENATVDSVVYFSGQQHLQKLMETFGIRLRWQTKTFFLLSQEKNSSYICIYYQYITMVR